MFAKNKRSTKLQTIPCLVPNVFTSYSPVIFLFFFHPQTVWYRTPTITSLTPATGPPGTITSLTREVKCDHILEPLPFNNMNSLQGRW